jgi:hypothetical protein
MIKSVRGRYAELPPGGMKVSLLKPMSRTVDPLSPLETEFLRLNREWCSDLGAIDPRHCPKRDTDLKALAALMIASECPGQLTAFAYDAADLAINAAAHRPDSWLDTTVWSIAQDFMNGSPYCNTPRLVLNLDNGCSAIRIWMMEIGWISRRLLDRVEIFPRLMNNVAGTLLGCDMAWGLAAELFETHDRFFFDTEMFEPSDFQAQYRDRIRTFRQAGVAAAQLEFRQLESECRLKIRVPLEPPPDPQLCLPFGIESED